MRSAFHQAMQATWQIMITTQILKTSVIANPTLAMRQLLNEPYQYAKGSGQLIELWPCHQLHDDSFHVLPVNNACTIEIPVEFVLVDKREQGFLDTTTKLIRPEGTSIYCSLVNEILLELGGKAVSYDKTTGRLTDIETVGTLGMLSWNYSQILNIKDTVYHQLVMHNWTEF